MQNENSWFKKDTIKLAACILHLQEAERLIKIYDKDISIALLELIDAIILQYDVSIDQINQINDIKTQILKK